MSREKCPDCNSSDGLATYADGTYCFSCEKSTKQKQSIIVFNKKFLDVPKDNQDEWPNDALDWLDQYQLGLNSLTKECYWSEERKRIVFRIDKAAWMRSVDPEQKLKWLFAGDKNEIFLYRRLGSEVLIHDPELCLVEDVVSAVRVSETMDCMALGGTRLNQNQLEFIRNSFYRKIYIFLDGDTAGRNGAEKIRKQLSLIRPSVIIRQKKDPKKFTYEELKEILK